MMKTKRSAREYIYQAFNVNDDESAFNACDMFLITDAEGTLVARIQPDNTLLLSFAPFSWSKYKPVEIVAPNRFDGIFRLVSKLLRQKGR